MYAVTRCLEIISEASRRVSDDVRQRQSSVPRKQIAGSGNVSRHDYEDVAAQMIWDTIHRGLPALKAAVAEELARSV
ncbi:MULTISPECIES: HepT-like ribonuclease domain-containing protein [Rhodopseudomonas]|uniref:HepT-like ribonuclease domain-containing protein n=1 Tax=Rhodopseudomonas TaxID=1073 RepID=UPI000641A92E|nr:HepT-like ribonuclease domain-containing protein [Rhodopseudomonas palustris]